FITIQYQISNSYIQFYAWNISLKKRVETTTLLPF
ncbi:MAG: hypothetical protein ACI9GM_001471, partial [Salibacteraceae bacterium]